MERVASRLGIALVISIAASGSALAQDDAWRGEALAAPCFACHGPGGESPGTIPSLDEPDEVGEGLLEFRRGKDKATIMGRIARGYTEEEIRILGRYFRELGQGEER